MLQCLCSPGGKKVLTLALNSMCRLLRLLISSVWYVSGMWPSLLGGSYPVYIVPGVPLNTVLLLSSRSPFRTDYSPMVLFLS